MINENNYETFFMSYIDNELNAAERAAVEAFVLSDSKYAAELAIFEKTKLQASSNEYIEMEDKIFLYRFPEMQANLDADFKKSLYKKEAPVRKVLFTPNVMRASFAIAALFILFIGIQLFKTNTVIKDKTAIAITNNASTNSKQTENTILPNEVNEASVNKINNNSAVLSSLPISKKIYNANIGIAESVRANQAGFEDQATATNNMNTNIINTTEGLSQTSRENENNNKLTAKFNEAQISSSSMETMASEEDKIISVNPNAFKEIDTEQEDRTINIGMIEIDGATFRGITRRVSALLKRNKIDKEK
jgi:hypothetical protein